MELHTIEKKAESLEEPVAGLDGAGANTDAVSGQILPIGEEMGSEVSALRAEMRDMLAQLRDDVARMHAHGMALFQSFRGEAIARLRDIQDRLPRNPH